MDPHQNPYTPGAGARPPRLVGRDGEIQDFRAAFTRLGAGQSARSFVLDGLRGVGKTVVLNEADIVAREHGWVSSTSPCRSLPATCGGSTRLLPRSGPRAVVLADPVPRTEQV